MTSRDQLSSDFRSALNAELAVAGCLLHIAETLPTSGRQMLLMANDGSELGWIPENTDAPVIVAFERILQEVRNKTLEDGS